MSIPNVRLILKMKLLQFDEDVRPAYYGTWTNKKSNIITHKQPLAKDAALFDYDADSEAEWEPEDDEGEDIHSADEQDDFEDSDMMDPEDTGWLVPEGYLSDSEGVNDEDEEEIENRKMKYQNGGHGISQRKSTRPTIQKIVLGPFFEGEEENHNTVEYEAFKVYETQLFIDIPREGYDPFYKEPSTSNATAVVSAIAGDMDNGQSTSATTNPSSKVEFTDVHKHALISVIIEKPTESIPNLIQEAKANSVLKDVSKRQLEMNIKNIAVKEKRGSDKVNYINL
ncbi:chromatin assembly factor 1 subunit A-domain-containing protein [Mycotypha africana]|uniref:chromatin assembly factor 1 subunit A-domain-containing protein n=1 Tax=Mycotypha africana TaxID=64632 RepID=UPI00230140BB|nr:chromatin assembly factor 1 subunit A-domain-containing protein [Mycotypha africana]KAI8992186.1 chromatin assembly factor 1 subunit A-domain-containing protein [Mycotypha africana]